MADIDFDELDKAVNDLMANVDTSKRPAGLDDPEDTVLTVPETTTQPTPEEAPVTDAATEVKTEPEAATSAAESLDTAKSEVTPASPSLAVKRRGQFMDIVHPSLNMNNTTPKPVSRQGATLQPSVDGVTAPVASTVPAAPAPEETLAEATVDQPIGEPATESTWPDPIDMATTSTDVAEPTEGVDTEESIEAVPDTTISEAPADPEPLSSPFLPDAKPEKRPLGGLSDALPATDATPTAPVETPPAAPVVLPEEFSGDLMAVESRDLSSHPDATKSEAPATPEPAESVVLAPRQQDEVPSAASAPSDPQPPAGGSIAQQYTEQPSSGDQTNGSIYDTATYHQAIAGAQPVKKKASPLTFIIWAVVLLLVGATAGAAYFYFTR